jgi:hypothetical protein
MAIEVNKLFNGNVYLDGTKELIGRASEITLPKIQPATHEHSGLGMVGSLSLPAGLQEMELEIKWSGFYADHLKAAGNPFTTNKLQARGNHEVYTPEGRTEERPFVVQMTGWWKETGLGTLKAREAADGYDDKLTLSYLKVMLGGEPLYEVDVYNNVWRVGGEDVLATYRQNLGGQ